ncbi:MAG: hypothetical protein SGILL_001936 [Bacillariaceae sp.]
MKQSTFHRRKEQESEKISDTRVCIKNLPPKTTERDLKEFLLEQGKSTEKLQITDCKVLKNAKGKSRKVAFVGFRDAEQTQYVIDTFHRAFLNMTRITVEPALAKKDAQDAADNTSAKVSQGTAAESDGDKKHSKTTDNADEEKRKKTNEKVEELLNLMGAGSKPKFWSNDAAEPMQRVTTAAAQNDDDADDDSSSNSSSSSDSDDSDSSDDDSDMDEDEKVSKEEGGKKVATSDLDFLRSKQKAVDDLEENVKDKKSKDEGNDASSSDSSSESSSSSSSDEDDDVETRDDAPKNKSAKSIDHSMVVDGDSDPERDEGNETETFSDTRLFVRNMPFEATEDELGEYFSPFGKLLECHIPVDDQKRNKGYAFVTFESPMDAREAMDQLDKIDFQGRLLHILKARPPPVSESNVDTSNLSWKQKQEQLRKDQETKTAGQSSKSWSSSFVRGDAVVDNLAERLGLRKGDLLGVKDGLSSGDAAVRLALGETQIIEENREYFREHGVNMDALLSVDPNVKKEESIKRSKSSILVKNLPFDTRLEELTKLFHMGDVQVNILLPPSRTIALVEFGHSTDAKKAFRKLAYRRFKHVPIYLEWAPLSSKKSSQETSNAKASSPADEATGKKASDTKGRTVAQPVDDTEGGVGGEEATSTLYIKNLNFGTDEENLKKVVESQVGGRVISVRIPRKIAPTKNDASKENTSMSMGYGFVELPSHELAKKAIKVLHGKLVDGHALEVAISSKNSTTTSRKSATAVSGKNPTKLMVRNVPFQATRKEILKLFGTFGQLRKVRLPKKFDGSHRGFAFVEFLTGKEALAAMNALSQTHLYGRHLVLEWASEEDDNMDRLRDKAKRDAGAVAAPQNKKIRFN